MKTFPDIYWREEPERRAAAMVRFIALWLFLLFLSWLAAIGAKDVVSFMVGMLS